MVQSLKEVIMQRDGCSSAEADDLIEEALDAVAAGADPEEVLEEMFGLEPDYIFDLID